MDHFSCGVHLRNQLKELVFDYMRNTSECNSSNIGMCQADIFRNCGLDWGNYKNARSSQQQFWLVALLRELEQENKIQRNKYTKRWYVNSKNPS